MVILNGHDRLLASPTLHNFVDLITDMYMVPIIIYRHRNPYRDQDGGRLIVSIKFMTARSSHREEKILSLGFLYQSLFTFLW
jgi:hypothetical protein